MEGEVNVENQTSGETDTGTATTGAETTPALDTQADSLNQQSQGKPTPFATGKEKFKIFGKEEEWDWDTTKKYAQLGKASTEKMERAAQIEKKANDTMRQLVELAGRDPDGLIRLFNPTYQGRSTAQDATTPGQEVDPRDAKISHLESQLQRITGSIEKQELEAEKSAIAKEFADAETKYPVLKGNKFANERVKSEYKRLLYAGVTDVTIEDVAFQVAKEWQDFKQQENHEIKKRLEENKNKSPLSPTPSGGSSQSKPMTREDVMRLAGKIS